MGMNDSGFDEKQHKLRRPQLVFDIGGVLATNLSPVFWELVAAHSNQPMQRLYRKYKDELSKNLWTGGVTEAAFWEWLCQAAEGLSKTQGKVYLAESLRPLPALRQLERWSHWADIHIMSNHLVAWVEPILMEVRPYLRTVTISSSVGWRKPQRELFEHVASQLPADSSVLFVDDQPSNLEQGASWGWSTLLANPEGLWTGKVDEWLGI